MLRRTFLGALGGCFASLAGLFGLKRKPKVTTEEDYPGIPLDVAIEKEHPITHEYVLYDGGALRYIEEHKPWKMEGSFTEKKLTEFLEVAMRHKKRS